jgi:hypothetical protein
MSGAGAEVVGQALIGVAKIKLVRIVMWIVAALLVLVSFTMPPRGDGALKTPIALAIILAIFAMIGAIETWRENAVGRIFWLLPKVAMGVAGLGIVAFLFWLKSRRRQKVEALPPPPRPEEIDRLIRLEQEEERAA